ncbi:MAG: MobC family plasmid mobilization relaxosome protein [Caulobacterales bacterium]|nr:MobC family plasmid mobilization relaxosome protein [Caulobacterales bacterium]
MAEPTDRKRPSPFSLRLSSEERARLERDAAHMPLGAYVKARLFGRPPSWRTRRSVATVAHAKSLAQVLGLLGQSRLASNLNQLAKAANMGTLPLTAETERRLQDACDDVRAIKGLLMRALGLKTDGAR